MPQKIDFEFRLGKVQVENVTLRFRGERRDYEALRALAPEVIGRALPIPTLPEPPPGRSRTRGLFDDAADAAPAPPRDDEPRTRPTGAEPPAPKTARPRKGRVKGEAIGFRHDETKFGTPEQAWKTREKALWMLRVLTDTTGGDAFTPSTLAKTFDAQFAAAGTLRPSNVSRDLKTVATGRDAAVSITGEGVRLLQAGRAVTDALVKTAGGTAG